jgi:hypothetical protein
MQAVRRILIGAAAAAGVCLLPAVSEGASAEPLEHLFVGSPIHLVGSLNRAGTVTSVRSTNWSGYADPGAARSFTRVTGSWVVPAATCTGGNSAAVFWVGIDGISSSDPTVQQAGTLVECAGGRPIYFDWWETYPTNPVQVVAPVTPGDHIVSTVTFSNRKYVMTVTDSTSPAASFTKSVACGTTPCENMSGEWIAEAPSNGTTIVPLTNFGKWTLTGAQATYVGASGTITGPPDSYKITMADSFNRVQAVPGALNSTGTSFQVTWKRSN